MASRLLRQAAADRKTGGGLKKAADRADPADRTLGLVPLPREADEGTPSERLAVLEDIIGRATDAAELTVRQAKERFVREAGPALARIHDHDELWKTAGYTSFVDYVQRRWGYSSTHGYLLVATVGVQKALPEGASANTGHVQVLAPVLRSEGPDAVREAWVKADKKNGQPTAATLKESVAALGYEGKEEKKAAITGQVTGRSEEASSVGQLENAVALAKRHLTRSLVKKALEENPDEARRITADFASWAETVSRPATK